MIEGHKAQGFCEAVFAHGGLEMGEAEVVWIGLAALSMDKQAVGHTAKQAQNPQGIGVADPAANLIQ